VVGYHAGLPLLPGGYVGVDVFFVLSGFLITGLLVREVEATGRISIRHFYARRVRRLLPAATLILLAVAVASAALLTPARARSVATDGVWAALFGANVRFAHTGTDYMSADAPPSPLQHYWSLAVEEQFYLVWPALVLAVAFVARRHLTAALRVVLVLVVAGSLLVSVQQTAHSATDAYFSPFTRAWELAAGALVLVWLPALRRLRRTRAAGFSLAGLLLVVLSSVAYTESTPFPGWAAAVPVAGVMLLLAGGTADPDGRVQGWLGARPMQRLGALSYSWYLWHWPVMVLAAAYAHRDLTTLEGLECAGASLLLAELSYRLVESPVRALPRLVHNPRASLAMGLSCVLAMLVGFQGLGATAGDVMSPEAQAAAAVRAQSAQRVKALPTAAQLRAELLAGTPATAPVANVGFVAKDVHPASKDHCQAGPRRSALPPLDRCWYGDPKAHRTVVNLGDSHASMWLPGLDLWGKRHGFRVHHLAKTSCPAADVLTIHYDLKRPFTECERFRRAAIKRIVQMRPDVVVVSSSRNDGDIVVDGRRLSGDARLRAYERGLASTLRQLAASGARLAVLGDVPFQDQRAVDCVSEHPKEPRQCGTRRSKAVDAGYHAAERRVASAAHAVLFDPIPLLCTDTRCPMVVGRLVAYYDKRHVTASFALRAAGALGTALRL
jgi:peptidoglycan/LPS O-acetylase OafA/YrhL